MEDWHASLKNTTLANELSVRAVNNTWRFERTVPSDRRKVGKYISVGKWWIRVIFFLRAREVEIGMVLS